MRGCNPTDARRPVRPAVYIPNYNGARRLGAGAAQPEEQTRPVDVVVVDNGSADGSAGAGASGVPRGQACSSWGATSASAPALNRAVARAPGRPADPAQRRRRVRAGLRRGDARRARRGRRDGRRGAAPGRAPGADRLRRRRRRPHPDGLRLPARRAGRGAPRRAAPLGPTGGAALYARDAFERSAASTSASSSTTRTSTWPCECTRPGARCRARRPRPGRCTPTRPASAPAAARSTPAPAGAAATCCAATG